MAINKVTTDVIDMSGNTGGLVWAKGATGDQPLPVDSTAGDLRENTTTGKTEVFNGTEWRNLKEAAPPLTVEYLIVAGGGAGGQLGGGGAGGLLTNYNGTGLSLSLGTAYPITVGPGGAGNTSDPPLNDGQDSIFSTLTANGGGAGAGQGVSPQGNANDGGSGGGAGQDDNAAGTVGNATPAGQGNNGGLGGGSVAGAPASGRLAGGGGGGAGTVGNSAAGLSTGGEMEEVD